MLTDILLTAGPLAGALFGFIIGRRERNLRKPLMYACECGHSLSMHQQSGRCKQNCNCQRYIGPNPIEIDFNLAPRQLGS